MTHPHRAACHTRVLSDGKGWYGATISNDNRNLNLISRFFVDISETPKTKDFEGDFSVCDLTVNSGSNRTGHLWVLNSCMAM